MLQEDGKIQQPQMHNSISQSDVKLPIIADPKLPIPLNPSYKYMHTNPIRAGYLSYLELRNTGKMNESFYLEDYAKKFNLPYQQSHKLDTRKAKKQSPRRITKHSHNKKTNLKYLNPNDSDIIQDDVDKILSYKSPRQSSKIFISQQNIQ